MLLAAAATHDVVPEVISVCIPLAAAALPSPSHVKGDLGPAQRMPHTESVKELSQAATASAR